VDHVLLVCGHARPNACAKAEGHIGADPGHPCGPSDATDPVMANKTGAFCELLNMTTATESGEMLVWGAEKLEYLEMAYDDALAAGETPQVPIIHLEAGATALCKWEKSVGRKSRVGIHPIRDLRTKLEITWCLVLNTTSA